MKVKVVAERYKFSTVNRNFEANVILESKFKLLQLGDSVRS